LLALCSSGAVGSFSAFVKSLARSHKLAKLGEASFSEVFSAVHQRTKASSVLKVIPFGNLNAKIEQTEVPNLVNELRITQALAAVDGFARVLATHVVQGEYSADLLDLWDDYDKLKGSANTRPDFYASDQHYCIIVLENAGTDLEHFVLNSWKEAASIFWQTVKALTAAEQALNFEHRDLHWGNIVLEATDETPEEMLRKMRISDGADVEDRSLHESHDIRVTVIDFTLSRAKIGDDVVYTPLDDPALFEGKNDYQFDVYRFMRKHFAPLDLPAGKNRKLRLDGTTEFDWAEYRPKTNVLWLHYLSERLLNHKSLLRPRRFREIMSSIEFGKGDFSELDAFRSIDSAYRMLHPGKKKFGSAAKEGFSSFGSAGDVLLWGESAGVAYLPRDRW
ncbi:uncharacterized protein V1510DRAFT_363322, partial [Dipodascopsis tothii]|uniref:uncharacterized protein n=1 Tax=Dipodascopsis tothii TaxID=44089 RepID=UPI0034CD51D3